MKKILVVAPSWVGDCMLMQPMLMRLKQRHPDCLIDVLAPAGRAVLVVSVSNASFAFAAIDKLNRAAPVTVTNISKLPLEESFIK